MTTSLGDEFPKQIERVEEILGYYEEIGPAGMFGAAMIKDTLGEAKLAWQSQDVVEMVRLYKEMQEIK